MDQNGKASSSRGMKSRFEAKLDQGEVVRSKSTTPTFAELLQRRISRRGVLQTGAAVGALAVTGPVLRVGVGGTAQAVEIAAQNWSDSNRAPMVGFTPIPPQPADSRNIVVPEGYGWAPLLKWGDPIHEGGPAFDPLNQTAEKQRHQIGYKCRSCDI